MKTFKHLAITLVALSSAFAHAVVAEKDVFPLNCEFFFHDGSSPATFNKFDEVIVSVQDPFSQNTVGFGHDKGHFFATIYAPDRTRKAKLQKQIDLAKDRGDEVTVQNFTSYLMRDMQVLIEVERDDVSDEFIASGMKFIFKSQTAPHIRIECQKAM